MKKIIWGLFGLYAILGCKAAANSDVPTVHYQIANRISLDGDGFWDYLTLEENTDRLFVSHGTQVQVVDLKTGKMTGVIADTKGVHGIAFATALGKGFISCGRDTSVVVFDMQTLAVIGKIKVTGANPDAILYDPATRRVFTFNHDGENATVIDAGTNRVIGTIALGGAPEFAVTDGRGTVFVNIEDKSEIAVFDAQTLKIIHRWSIQPGESPSGLAFDVKNGRLFAVCENKKMVVVDAKTGHVVQVLPIGEGVDGVAFDPATRRIFSSNGEGSMTVIEEKTPNEFHILATVPTQRGARTIILDPKTHHLYLPTSECEAPVGDARPKWKPGTFVVLEMMEK